MNIALSISEGRVIRDLFENGFLEILQARDIQVTCFTPAANVPSFISRWKKEGISFQLLYPYKLDNLAYRALHLRERILHRIPEGIKLWEKIEWKFYSYEKYYRDAMQGIDLAVITHPMFHSEMPIFLAAKTLNIPTLGVLRSWDNLYKGLRIRTDILAVWNEVNRQEAIQLLKFEPERVVAIGGAQFDAYFSPEANWSRNEFAEKLKLDPDRPIITLATLGAFLPMYDETYLVDFLLQAIQEGKIPSNAQLVIRLHPASKLEYFSKYLGLPNVRISYIDQYIPTLGWTMTRQDVQFMANLLRHSDVVVSPGSTITIETAIFDTPTVVPIFHTYQPELANEQYGFHLAKHFKRLAELDLVPIIRNPEDLIPAINRALTDRSWYQAQREQLVKDYIGYTDGKSTERLVNLIEKITR
jgi:hypothetical protein